MKGTAESYSGFAPPSLRLRCQDAGGLASREPLDTVPATAATLDSGRSSPLLMPSRIYTHRRTAPILSVAVLGLLMAAAALPAGSQQSSSDQTGLSPAQFLLLQGSGCAVRYIPGGLDRAHHLLNRLQLLTDYFHDWTEMPSPTMVYVMNREEWGRAGLADVYGLPLRLSRTSIAVPGAGDSETVSFWHRILGSDRVPLIPGVPLQGTMEEAGTMAVADVLLQVDVARGFVERTGMRGRQLWLGEVASHAVAQVVFDKHEARKAEEIAATYHRLGDRLGGARAHAVSEYRPLPVEGREGTERWLWFQAQFFDGARVLTRKHGVKAIKRLLKMTEENGGLLSEAQVLGRYPELAAWLQSAFAAEP